MFFVDLRPAQFFFTLIVGGAERLAFRKMLS
jgi:hypothetical protein